MKNPQSESGQAEERGPAAVQHDVAVGPVLAKGGLFARPGGAGQVSRQRQADHGQRQHRPVRARRRGRRRLLPGSPCRPFPRCFSHGFSPDDGPPSACRPASEPLWNLPDPPPPRQETGVVSVSLETDSPTGGPLELFFCAFDFAPLRSGRTFWGPSITHACPDLCRRSDERFGSSIYARCPALSRAQDERS